MKERNRMVLFGLLVVVGFVMVVIGGLWLAETQSPFRPSLDARITWFTLERSPDVGASLRYQLTVRALDDTGPGTCAIVARDRAGSVLGNWSRAVPPLEIGTSLSMGGSVSFPIWVRDMTPSEMDLGVTCQASDPSGGLIPGKS
jgi:hypothetical protein